MPKHQSGGKSKKTKRKREGKEREEDSDRDEDDDDDVIMGSAPSASSQEKALTAFQCATLQRNILVGMAGGINFENPLTGHRVIYGGKTHKYLLSRCPTLSQVILPARDLLAVQRTSPASTSASDASSSTSASAASASAASAASASASDVSPPSEEEMKKILKKVSRETLVKLVQKFVDGYDVYMELMYTGNVDKPNSWYAPDLISGWAPERPTEAERKKMRDEQSVKAKAFAKDNTWRNPDQWRALSSDLHYERTFLDKKDEGRVKKANIERIHRYLIMAWKQKPVEFQARLNKLQGVATEQKEARQSKSHVKKQRDLWSDLAEQAANEGRSIEIQLLSGKIIRGVPYNISYYDLGVTDPTLPPSSFYRSGEHHNWVNITAFRVLSPDEAKALPSVASASASASSASASSAAEPLSATQPWEMKESDYGGPLFDKPEPTSWSQVRATIPVETKESGVRAIYYEFTRGRIEEDRKRQADRRAFIESDIRSLRDRLDRENNLISLVRKLSRKELLDTILVHATSSDMAHARSLGDSKLREWAAEVPSRIDRSYALDQLKHAERGRMVASAWDNLQKTWLKVAETAQSWQADWPILAVRVHWHPTGAATVSMTIPMRIVQFDAKDNMYFQAVPVKPFEIDDLSHDEPRSIVLGTNKIVSFRKGPARDDPGVWTGYLEIDGQSSMTATWSILYDGWQQPKRMALAAIQGISTAAQAANPTIGSSIAPLLSSILELAGLSGIKDPRGRLYTRFTTPLSNPEITPPRPRPPSASLPPLNLFGPPPPRPPPASLVQSDLTPSLAQSAFPSLAQSNLSGPVRSDKEEKALPPAPAPLPAASASAAAAASDLPRGLQIPDLDKGEVIEFRLHNDPSTTIRGKVTYVGKSMFEVETEKSRSDKKRYPKGHELIVYTDLVRGSVNWIRQGGNTNHSHSPDNGTHSPGKDTHSPGNGAGSVSERRGWGVISFRVLRAYPSI